MAQKSVFREYFEALLIAVVFATFARTYVVQAFKIPSGSMEENLLIGDHILVNKFLYGPAPSALERRLLPVRDLRRGDVVVFKSPEEPERDFIKRCVALPGDRVEIVNKKLFVNGDPVDEAAYTYHTDRRVYPASRFSGPYRPRDNYGPEVIPAGHYFCLGDNRDNSNDSRYWGPVPAELIKGRALLIYWSYEDHWADDPGRARQTGPWGRIKRVGYFLVRLIPDSRWQRTFHLVR
jgi:signal peptidase I